MPSRRLHSQPDASVHPWLRRPAGRQLVADVQRMAIPELTRIFGQYGLYLRPSAEMPAELSGNMLGRVISVHRAPRGFDGQVRCADAELPVASGSLSLVYSLFCLETSPDPAQLVAEIARVLKPEGVAMLICANPWSLARRGPAMGVARAERLGREAGLDRVRCHCIGPYWPRIEGAVGGQAGSRWFDGFRAATLLVLRRREAGLTPLRKSPAAVGLRPGMSAG